MAVSETTAAPAGTAADAVRALLGVLGAPALGQALVLEKALAGRLQDLDRAPDAAGFDPLARPPIGTAPVRPRTPSPDATGRRRPSPSEPAAVATRGIGALIGDVFAGNDRASSPAAGTLSGIAAALAGLSGPAPGKAQARATQPAPSPTPGPTSARQAARAVALSSTGAVSQAAGLGAQALAAVPGTAGVAPVLGQIAALGNALWWQIALTPPAQTATPAQPPAQRPARGGPGGTGTQTGSPAARGRVTTLTPGADASTTDHARSALAGIGRLTVELFEYAARAGAASQTSGQTPAAPQHRPAPRAPSVLAPARGERSAPPAAGDSTAAVASAGSAPAAMVPAVSTPPASADDLARALRAEGLLRGVDLP